MFPLVLITPEENHPSESAIIAEICSRYEVPVHVRKPGFSKEEYQSYLSQYSNDVLEYMVIHEHHELMALFSVKGIHLKEKDRIQILKEPFHSNIISSSFHTISDVAASTYTYRYIFFSPLFKSISKQNYGNNDSNEQLTELHTSIQKHTSTPVIGLGGINEENVLKVKESGFDGAALLGAVWLSDDPVKAFEKIWERVNAGAS